MGDWAAGTASVEYGDNEEKKQSTFPLSDHTNRIDSDYRQETGSGVAAALHH